MLIPFYPFWLCYSRLSPSGPAAVWQTLPQSWRAETCCDHLLWTQWTLFTWKGQMCSWMFMDFQQSSHIFRDSVSVWVEHVSSSAKALRTSKSSCWIWACDRPFKPCFQRTSVEEKTSVAVFISVWRGSQLQKYWETLTSRISHAFERFESHLNIEKLLYIKPSPPSSVDWDFGQGNPVDCPNSAHWKSKQKMVATLMISVSAFCLRRPARRQCLCLSWQPSIMTVHEEIDKPSVLSLWFWTAVTPYDAIKEPTPYKLSPFFEKTFLQAAWYQVYTVFAIGLRGWWCGECLSRLPYPLQTFKENPGCRKGTVSAFGDRGSQRTMGARNQGHRQVKNYVKGSLEEKF